MFAPGTLCIRDHMQEDVCPCKSTQPMSQDIASVEVISLSRYSHTYTHTHTHTHKLSRFLLPLSPSQVAPGLLHKITWTTKSVRETFVKDALRACADATTIIAGFKGERETLSSLVAAIQVRGIARTSLFL